MRKALLVTGVVLGLGLLLKDACGSKETYFYCYSDFQPLYIERQLGGGRFPYFPPALEYPAGTGLMVWATSAATSSARSYYQLNIAILAAVGLCTTALLVRLVGDRSLYFAASASLGLWGFVTWDLIPVALTVAAVSAYLTRRSAVAGALAGVGAATKVFPGLLAISLALDAMGDRRAVRVVLAFVGAVVALNLPIMVASFEGWAHFISSVRVGSPNPGPCGPRHATRPAQACVPIPWS